MGRGQVGVELPWRPPPEPGGGGDDGGLGAAAAGLSTAAELVPPDSRPHRLPPRPSAPQRPPAPPTFCKVLPTAAVVPEEWACFAPAGADDDAAAGSGSSGGGAVVRLFKASYPANAPSEDRSTLAVARGFVFAGVWDGHGGAAAAEHCEATAWPDFKAALAGKGAAATVGEAFQRGLRCARHAGTYLWQACTGAAMVAAPSSHCHAGPHAGLRATDAAYLARHAKDDPAKLFCGR
jgi:hypothetical protein